MGTTVFYHCDDCRAYADQHAPPPPPKPPSSCAAGGKTKVKAKMETGHGDSDGRGEQERAVRCIANRLYRQWRPVGEALIVAGARVSLGSLESCVAAGLDYCDAPRRAALVRMLQLGTGGPQWQRASAAWLRYISTAVEACGTTAVGGYFRAQPAVLPALFAAAFACEWNDWVAAPAQASEPPDCGAAVPTLTGAQLPLQLHSRAPSEQLVALAGESEGLAMSAHCSLL
jgi:hypothetical protein